MAQGKIGRLLVVDDEIETLTPLCDLLSEWGYEVTRCTSGKEALEAFEKQQFDVLLTDLVMPEMDGISLIKEAMKIEPLLVSIIITGHGTIETAVDAMKNGAFDYVLKPIEWKLLRPIISGALETRKLRESEKLFHSIVKDQTELICRWKPGGILTYVNEVYCRYFDKKPEQLIGHSFMPLIPEEDYEEVLRHFASLTQENPASTNEHRVLCADDEVCWQQWTNRAFFDKEGTIIEYQSVGRDITDYKKKDEALKKEQFKLREYFEHLPVPAYNVSFDGKIIDCNHMTLNFLGYDTKDELIGKPVISTIYAPSFREKAKQLFEKWKRWGKIKNEEIQVITKQGEIKDILLNVNTIYDHEGHSLYSISTQLDITERKKAEEQLHFLSSMVEQSLDSIISTDTDFRITHINKAAEELFGWTLDELKGKTPEILNAEQEADEIQKQIYSALSSEQSYSAEALNRRKDGSTFYCQFRISPLINKNGDIYGYMGSQRDVTDRVQAMLDLQKSEEKYCDLYDNAPDMYHTLDENGMIINCNETEARMLGYKKEEIIGRPITDFFTEDSKLLFEIDYPRAKVEKSLLNIGREFIRKDGTIFPAVLNVTAHFDKTGNFTGTKTIARDTTEQKLAEKSLQESELRFRGLFENMGSGVAIYRAINDGEDFIFTDINRAGEIIDTVKKESIIGKCVTETFPGIREFGLLDVFQRVWRTGKRENYSASFYKDERINGWRDNYVYRLPSGEIVSIYDDITDRKLAEEAIQESEEKYRIHFENVNDVIYSVDTDFKIINISPSVKKILGYEPEELTSRKFQNLNIIAPQSLEAAFTDTMRVLSGETISASVYEFIAKDGTRRYGEISGSPLFKDGKIIAVVSVARDITVRKWAEEKLKESEERYRTLFEEAIDSIFLADLKTGMLVDCNIAATKLVERKKSEIIGKHQSILHPAEDITYGVSKTFESHLTGESSDLLEDRVITKSGQIKDVAIRASKMTIEGNEVMQGIFRDITDQKQAEVKLMESEEKYRLLFEAKTDAVMVFDGESRKCIDTNNAASTLYGYSHEEFLNIRLQDISAEQDKSEITFRKTLGGKLSKVPIRYHRKKDGTVFPVEISAGIFTLKGQQIVIGTIRDITERKQAEKALKDSEERLKSIFRAAPVGIGVVSASDRVLMDVNDELCKLLGYYERDLIGKSARKMYQSNKEYNTVWRELNKQIKEYGIGTVETQWKRQDGRIIDVILNSTPINRRDSSQGITFSALDITERKFAESQIRQSEARMRTLADAAFEGIIFHKTGVLIQANNQFCEMFGFNLNELIGKDIIKLLIAREAQASVKKQIAGKFPGPYETVGMKKNGTRFPMEIRARETELEGENVRVAAVIDITERKQAEETLRGLSSRISEIEESERKRLAQELHDQVGQNLTALGINLSTLPTLILPKEARKIIKRLKDTQNLLDETTQSIRNVMADLRPSVLDDYGLIAAVRWYSGSFSERTGIPVKTTAQSLFPRLPSFLETTLYRIVQEGLTNVSKHARATRVNIGIRETKDKVTLTVADNGKGFNFNTVLKKKKQNIWGLLTMKERAEAIGGTLGIESSPGKGTKILIEINR